MKMYVSGQWIDKPQTINVVNPYDNSIIDSVPRADPSDVERALGSAVRGAQVMAKLPGYERWKILRKAAEIILEQNEELGRLISSEEGKVIAEGRLEANRAFETIMGSAEEAKRLHGETVPLDGAPGGAGKIGLTLRVPCGVVAAIAAGNAVVLKPATDTPLSALKLTLILLEAGLPPEGIQCLTGSGGEIGDLICGDPRVRKITFTGSRDVGEHICRTAGIKKVTMELGSNSPVVVMPDVDLDKVAAAVTLGNQLDEKTRVGPMVREREAARVDEWVREAVAQGARVVVGGERRGALYAPTIVADVKPEMRIS